MKIIKSTFNWRRPNVARRGKPKRIIHHHTASTGQMSVQDIHNIHYNKGWNGIGYHYYVRKSGKVYAGRPVWAMGAHTAGHNDDIGICSEGNFQTEKMGDEQRESIRALVGDITKQYPGIENGKHRDFNATACPGKDYPFAYVIKPIKNIPPAIPGKSVRVPVPKKRPKWWGKMMRWVKANRGK